RLGSRRPNLTRQHSVAADHSDAPAGRIRYPQQQPQPRFLSPQPLSRHLTPGPHLVHQRSSESHDSTVSAASMASAASYGGRTGWSGAEGAEGYSMDLLNMRRDDEDDEDGEDRKDEASIKGLWKRAFSSLKIRDRIKSPKKKKGSKDEEDDIDPVYYLLKHAADKGTQRCPACSQQQPTTSSGASAS
uniref:BESS domain-containing protein n=1 Tax=Macrostomum lignano TaxID=282301 RepID=A0A1I8HYH8_9PLAT